eukprot:15363436-Ditylum_brightwellii.AAC.1
MKYEEVLGREQENMDRMVHHWAVIDDCGAKEQVINKHPSLYPEQDGQPLKVAMVRQKKEQEEEMDKNLDIKVDANPTLILQHAKKGKENSKSECNAHAYLCWH